MKKFAQRSADLRPKGTQQPAKEAQQPTKDAQPTKAIILQLLYDLGKQHEDMMDAAEAQLQQMGTAALPHLLDIALDSQYGRDVRSSAIHFITQMKEDAIQMIQTQVVPRLRDALSSETDNAILCKIALVLGEFKDEDSIPKLELAMGHEHTGLQITVSEALVEICKSNAKHWEEVREIFRSQLTNSDKKRRVNGISAISLARKAGLDVRHEASLIELMAKNDESKEVRRHAVDLLARMKMDELFTQLSNPDELVRETAVRGIVEIGKENQTPERIPSILGKALDDPNPLVRLSGILGAVIAAENGIEVPHPTADAITHMSTNDADAAVREKAAWAAKQLKPISLP